MVAQLPDMPKLKVLEALLEELQSLKRQPVSEESRTVLQQNLQSKLGVVVAKAAEITADLGIESLATDLLIAFDRLTRNPVQVDPGCLAKVEIVDALRKLKQREYDLFVQGSRYEQWEPIWGGQEDRAGHLRGRCALALAELGYADALLVIGNMLADPTVEARMGAAQAVACYGSTYGIPLLRLRAIGGETSPQVLEVIFTSLLALCQPQTQAIEFIAKFLDSEIAEAPAVAAIALGDSRNSEAFQALQAWIARPTETENLRVAFAAMAAMRLPEAFDYLIDAIERGTDVESAIAFESLNIYRGDTAIWERVETALSNRNS